MTLRWIVAGGGTGGHVTPALALGEALRAAGDAVRFVGSRRGLEGRLVPEAGFELTALDARPVLGRSAAERARALVALLGAARAARREIRRFGADGVIAVGGYASVPAALGALLARRPLLLVNADAQPGLANRLVARFARRIFCGFEAAAGALARGPGDERLRVTGVPLRAALVETLCGASARRRRAEEPLHLLVFGGSQGACQLNDVFAALAPRLAKLPLEVVHQTGEADRERVRAAWSAAGVPAEVLAFEPDMPARYRWADLVCCRAGAVTVAELGVAGRPALLVPLAHVGGGEQLANARELERAGGARVFDASRLEPAELAEAVEALARDSERLAAMAAAAARCGRPDAAARIAREARALLGTGADPGRDSGARASAGPRAAGGAGAGGGAA